MYLGESFPLRVRAKCIALGSATSASLCIVLVDASSFAFVFLDWLWNFLLSFFAPRIAEKCVLLFVLHGREAVLNPPPFCRIGPLILLIFFGMLVFGYVYVYFAIPETKGLSLEEVGPPRSILS